jgi:hypothetical protein
MKVINLADQLNNNKMTTPVQILREVLDDYEMGKRTAPKMIILMLDSSAEHYSTNFVAANMKVSELMTLCALFQAKFSKWLLGD